MRMMPEEQRICVINRNISLDKLIHSALILDGGSPLSGDDEGRLGMLMHLR
jgi:hypothetical protein